MSTEPVVSLLFLGGTVKLWWQDSRKRRRIGEKKIHNSQLPSPQPSQTGIWVGVQVAEALPTQTSLLKGIGGQGCEQRLQFWGSSGTAGKWVAPWKGCDFSIPGKIGRRGWESFRGAWNKDLGLGDKDLGFGYRDLGLRERH